MTILVTGATGNVGRLVVDELLRAGVTDVRALTIDPARAALPLEVDVVEGWLGRPSSVAAALKGVERMYLAPVPQTVHEVLGAAAAAGVAHVVDLAGPHGHDWHVIEEAVEASGLAWTHLEPGEYHWNALMWAAQIRETGAVRDAHPDSANAPIDARDIAAVAAAALIGDRHIGRVVPMTGPETITRVERVRLIGAALGREIAYVEVTRDEAIAELAPVMGEFAAWYVDGAAELVERPQPVEPGVAEILGRPGITFGRWAVDHADAFR